MFTSPITDPVLIFAIAMVLFLFAPLIMTRFKIPGIIGLIFAGVIIGPNGFGLLDRDPTIVLLGTVGLLYIIFIAGLELDLEGFKKYRQKSLVFGTFSFIIPFILGTVLGFVLNYSVAGSILLGSILGSHTLLAYPIASRFGVTKNKAVTTTVGGTLVTDTSSFVLLAIIAASVEGEITTAFWIKMFISLAIYVALVFIVIPYLARFFFRIFSTDGNQEFIFVMAILFVTAYGARLAGLEPIIGAFLAGLALNRYIIEHGPLMNRIKFVGNALFIPFFLLSVGMLMDVRLLLTSPSSWLFASLIVLFVSIGKYLGAYVSGKLFGFTKEKIKIMFGLSVPQAAGTLAATLVGYDLGLFDQGTVNGMIVMILVTCIVGPYTVEKYSRKLALLEKQKPYEPSEAPKRILIPIANPKTMKSLLDLAFVIRGKTQEPIYPLTVAQTNEERSAEAVAEGEKMLSAAVTYAAGANVPVQLLTRIDRNITSGIVRAIEESRITTVVIGWNGKLSTPQRIFGSVLDHLLEQTDEAILVSKISQPLNTTKRIILILPKSVDHKSGYYDAVKTIKEIAYSLGANLSVIVVKDDIKGYEETFKQIKPNVTTQFSYMPSWGELIHSYLNTLKKDDLVIVLSSRRGTIGWHPRLEELPRKLATSTSESFIIFYPQEKEAFDSRGTKGIEMPRTILPKREYED